MEHSSIDTNAIIRVITNDVPEKRDKVVILLSNPRYRIHIADLAIYEAFYVLTTLYEYPRDILVKKMKYFLSIDSIECSRGLFEKVFDAFLEHPKLSFADCYLAEYASENNHIPLYTFDHKLATQLDNAVEII